MASVAVRIGQHQLVVAAGVETDRRHSRVNRGRIDIDELGIAARDVRIDRPVDRTSVDGEPAQAEGRIDRLRKIDDRERVAILAVDVIEVQAPAREEAGRGEVELGLEADIGAKHRRHLDVRIDRLGVAFTARGPVDAIGLNAGRNTGERTIGDDVDLTGRTAGRVGIALSEAEAVVLERVAEPDQRIAAGEHADAAPKLGAGEDAEIIEIVGEGRPRQDHGIEIVEPGRVREAVALKVQWIDVRRVTVIEIRAHAQDDVQLVVDAPVVLQVEGISIPLEPRSRVVDVAGPREIAESAFGSAADDIVRERARRVAGAGRKQARLEIRDVAEDKGSGRVLNEQVEDLGAVQLDAGLELVVAGIDVHQSAILFDRGLKVIGRARSTRPGKDGAAGDGARIVDADDDSRNRIVRLRFAAADRILAIGNLGTRVTQLGRDRIGDLRIEAGRVIVREGAADREGVEPGHLR